MHTVWNHLKKRAKDGVAYPGVRDRDCAGWCRVRAQMHPSHRGHAAELEDGTTINFCSDCGAYGTTKAVLLKAKCRPETRAKRMAQWTALNLKRVHPVFKSGLGGYRRIEQALGVFGTLPKLPLTILPGSSQGAAAVRTREDFVTPQGWEFYEATRVAANNACSQKGGCMVPGDAQGAGVNLDANPDPNRAADRDSAMCNKAVDRQNEGMASSSSAEGPQASPDPKTDPQQGPGHA